VSRFGVTPEKEAQLLARMEACGLREADCEETFTCSGGPGGQKVNRTATCVHLKHLPSGLEVKMQQERSQGLNRFFARTAAENVAPSLAHRARIISAYGARACLDRYEARSPPP
jgi:protein subunit release factor B